MITIIGLGTEKGDISMRALETLKCAKRVIVRNSSPAAEALRGTIEFVTLDGIYEKSRNFTSLANNIAAEVKKHANDDVCYCVEGGVFEDRAAQLLIKSEKNNVQVIEGVSKSEKAAAKAGLFGGYTAISAYEVTTQKLSLPLVVYDLDNRLLAGDVKLALAERFGDEAEALYVNGATAKKIPLYEADRQEEYSALSALVIYDIPLLQKKRFDFEDLICILKRLRAPDGCPWDKVQTHKSIRINAIEEAYELVDAIDLDDPDKMCEEAGDVVMQAAFHTLIEEEKGGFTVTDMLSGVCEKLITRHTHVFGADSAKNADVALSVWDKNKMTEKHQVTYSDAVNDVPACFPALLRAQKICKRMSQGGWGFKDFERNVGKLNEEIDELREAMKENDSAHIAEEFGDVLMVLSHIAYWLKIDSEQALLDTVKKVQKRYTVWEKLVIDDKKDVNSLTNEEWFFYYKKAKEQCKNET